MVEPGLIHYILTVLHNKPKNMAPTTLILKDLPQSISKLVNSVILQHGDVFQYSGDFVSLVRSSPSSERQQKVHTEAERLPVTVREPSFNQEKHKPIQGGSAEVLENSSLHPKTPEAKEGTMQVYNNKYKHTNSLTYDNIPNTSATDKEFWNYFNINLIKFSDLQIVKPPLGMGSFGTVYRGIWCFEQVAIKTIHETTKNVEALFRHEVMSLFKSNSTHIVRLIGICVPPDPYALVMEYMAGGNLATHLASEDYKKSTIYERVGHAVDVAIGMFHVHLQNIVHRDLTPRNILLSDSKKHCKIGDFGQAKETANTLHDSEIKGSLPYMAPEIIAENPVFNSKTDSYAFGICMYELWTGDFHFTNHRKAMLLLPKLTSVTDPLRPIFPESCDPAYVKLAEQCWSVVPAARPTFAQIIPALMEIRDRLQIVDIRNQLTKHISEYELKHNKKIT